MRLDLGDWLQYALSGSGRTAATIRTWLWGTTAGGYAIITSPRSGSNLLCQYLASTGVLGNPLEYFNAQARRILDHPLYPDDPVLQVQQILTTGTTPNSIYGVKVFACQHLEVSATLDWTSWLPSLTYIYLQRNDRLGQALSWARALQTSQYRSTQPRQKSAVYTKKLIQDRLNALAWQDLQWWQFFNCRCISPLKIVYEDFIGKPEATVNRVAALFGIKAEINEKLVNLEMQRDTETEEWRRRFLQEHGM
jgi:LPS sulfotransferase NodH